VCCGKTRSWCKLQPHKKAKTEFFQDEQAEDIDHCIVAHLPCAIKYTGGQHPGEERTVIPSEWLHKNMVFKALCCTSNLTKTYHMDKVMSVSILDGELEREQD
jgi:predicted DNA-binding transcriptional regulator YafY